MLFGHVGGLANVLAQIDQKRFFEAHAIHWRDMPIDQKRRSAGLFFLPWQMQLPFTLSNCLQVNTQVIIKGLGRVGLIEFSVEQVGDVFPVDNAVLWDFGSRQGCKGWQYVQRAGDLVAGGARRNAIRSPEYGRHSHSSLEGGHLAAAQGACRTPVIPRQTAILMILVLDQPRAVVAGEEDVGILRKPHLLDSIQNSSDVEIDLLNDVAVQPTLALPLELGRGV